MLPILQRKYVRYRMLEMTMLKIQFPTTWRNSLVSHRHFLYVVCHGGR